MIGALISFKVQNPRSTPPCLLYALLESWFLVIPRCRHCLWRILTNGMLGDGILGTFVKPDRCGDPTLRLALVPKEVVLMESEISAR